MIFKWENYENENEYVVYKFRSIVPVIPFSKLFFALMRLDVFDFQILLLMFSAHFSSELSINKLLRLENVDQIQNIIREAHATACTKTDDFCIGAKYLDIFFFSAVFFQLVSICFSQVIVYSPFYLMDPVNL